MLLTSGETILSYQESLVAISDSLISNNLLIIQQSRTILLKYVYAIAILWIFMHVNRFIISTHQQ